MKIPSKLGDIDTEPEEGKGTSKDKGPKGPDTKAKNEISARRNRKGKNNRLFLTRDPKGTPEHRNQVQKANKRYTNEN